MKKLWEKLTTVALGFILVANLIDIVFTQWFIIYGNLGEANPLMEALFMYDPFLFVAIKTALVSGGVYILSRPTIIKKRSAQLAAYFCFSIYFALMASFYFFIFMT